MAYNVQTLVEHGYITLFLASLIERLGVPVFTTPIVVGAGLLAASGKLSLALVIMITVVATLLGDWVWFELGRRRGKNVVGLLCRIDEVRLARFDQHPDAHRPRRRRSDVPERRHRQVLHRLQPELPQAGRGGLDRDGLVLRVRRL